MQSGKSPTSSNFTTTLTSGPVQEVRHKSLLRSAPAAMIFPVRPLCKRWPAIVERSRLRRFFWVDPCVVQNDAVTAEAFRAAMSAFWFDGTYKITGANRHPAADQLLIDHVPDLEYAHIVDIGASDGSTSIDLMRRLPGFARYTMSDRFIEVTAVKKRHRTHFFDTSGRCSLIVGRRLLAWPTMSRSVRLLTFPFRHGVQHEDPRAEAVLLLNPEVRELIRNDSRVHWRAHNIFEPWTGPRPDVIKVANLLRRLYFDDETILDALTNVLTCLPDGGHLLIVDNSRIPQMPPRAGLYRRSRSHFEVVAETIDTPEISELVASVRTDAHSSTIGAPVAWDGERR